MTDNFLDDLVCINRNIVECKVSLVNNMQCVTSGINRNIVECKDSS